MSEYMKVAAQYFFGNEPIIIYALLLIMAVDYTTGVCAAIYNKKLCSSIGYRGITKKIGMICIVVLGHILGAYIMHDSNVLRNTTAMFYLANEIVSIFENANRMGLPLPEKLKDAFAKIRETDKSDSADEDS